MSSSPSWSQERSSPASTPTILASVSISSGPEEPSKACRAISNDAEVSEELEGEKEASGVIVAAGDSSVMPHA